MIPKLIHPVAVSLFKRRDAEPDADGYIVFMAADFDGKTGDEMTAPNTDARLVIGEVRPVAHYGGRNWHVRAYFTRKRATK